MKIFNFQFSIFKSKKGFTLLEFLVAISLFTMFMAVATGGFVRALRTQRAMTALMSANDNASLALEQMAREMRTGYNFCTKTDPIPEFPECNSLSENEIMFVNINNQVVYYRLYASGGLAGHIQRAVRDILLQKTFENITADDVKIKKFNIKLLGNKKEDGLQPRVTIGVEVSPKSDVSYLENIYTSIQTTVSSRIIDG